MTDVDENLDDHFEYHSDELELSGDPETGDWSIRCVTSTSGSAACPC